MWRLTGGGRASLEAAIAVTLGARPRCAAALPRARLRLLLQRCIHSSSLHAYSPPAASRSRRSFSQPSNPSPSTASADLPVHPPPSRPKRQQSLLSDELQRIIFQHSDKQKHQPTARSAARQPNRSGQQTAKRSPAPPAPQRSAPDPVLSTSPPIVQVDVHRTSTPPLLASALRQFVHTSGPLEMSAITSDTHYSSIPPSEEVRLSHLPPFLTSSRDPLLLTLAASHSALIACSSSSTTSILSRFYMAQVGEAHVDTSELSAAFQKQPSKMTARARAPMAATLRKRRVRDGVVQERLLSLGEMEAGKEVGDDPALQAPGTVEVWGMDRGYAPEATNRDDVLLRLGHSMEHLFTMEKAEFNAHFLHQPDASDASNAPAFKVRNSFLFSLANRTLMRSQLDCHAPTLLSSSPSSDYSSTPSSDSSSSTAVFDIKTRAVAPIRYDLAHYQQHLSYHINQAKGLLNSYEKEWYDMARTVFLKYALQCRMGRMQGIMVAYHNTQTVFGMEMISLQQMERTLLGKHAPLMADRVYEMSVRMLDEVGRRVVEVAQALHGGRRVETIKLVVSQVVNDPALVHIYAELLPPPAQDFDAHLPFTHRHSTLYRLDQLDFPSLQRVAAAHGVRVGEQQTRSELLSQLETAFSSATTRYLPPLLHLSDLLRTNHLIKLALRVHHATADGRALSAGDWRLMEAGEVSSMRSGYTLHVVNTAEMSEGERMKEAWEYSSTLETGYLLEREEVEAESLLDEVDGQVVDEQAGSASPPYRTGGHRRRKQLRWTPPSRTEVQWADDDVVAAVDVETLEDNSPIRT